MPTTVFRPVGLHELALIWDSRMHEFPPRLPHQPIFYPVTNAEYARQIARDWNTRDEKSGCAGFVTEFAIESGHIAKFAPHVVGASEHQEYWIPSEELGAFNKAIIGSIRVREGFFGTGFIGCVPDAYGLKGKDATTQMATLVKTWEPSTSRAKYQPTENPYISIVYSGRKTTLLNPVSVYSNAMISSRI